MSPEAGAPDVAQLRSLITGYEAAQVVYVAARLGVADLLAAGPYQESLLEPIGADSEVYLLPQIAGG